MIIFEGKVHISTWYQDSPLPPTWRIAVSENGWTTDELTLEWLQQVFEPQTRSRTVGRYRLLILDGHGSHMTPELRQRTNATSPTDRNLQKIIKGCQMAMHNATLLQEENSRLRAENTRQKQRRQHRRAFIQTGGSMTIGEGVATSEHQKTPKTKAPKVPKAQEARVEDQEAEVTAVEAVEPNVRKRAPPRCSLCNSTEHTARTCHCK